jgi:hypothetical protein
MTTPLERPKTPVSVIIIGSAIALLIALFVFQMIIGFVITITKLAIAVAVITGVVIVMNRAFGDD